MSTGKAAPWTSRLHDVSPVNFEEEITERITFPNPLRFFDSTLRKILLTPGLRVRMGDLSFVAEQLESVGISEVMLNVAPSRRR